MVVNPDFISHGPSSPTEWENDGIQDILLDQEINKIECHSDYADVFFDFFDEHKSDEGQCPYKELNEALQLCVHDNDTKKINALMQRIFEYTAERNIS